MTRKGLALVVLIVALGTALVSSAVPGRVRMAYPGSMDCQKGCDFVAGGWPFLYLVDQPGISPVGSVSLGDGLLGADIIRPGAFSGTLLFWIGAWTVIIWMTRRARWPRSN
jgi:hypothetical protein